MNVTGAQGLPRYKIGFACLCSCLAHWYVHACVLVVVRVFLQARSWNPTVAQVLPDIVGGYPAGGWSRGHAA